MAMGPNMERGRAGEAQALRYLEARGWRILEKNWRYRHREIDIIARKNTLLAIIEVKVRSTIGRERLEEHVPRQKQRFLVSAADAYARQHRINLEIRFDLIVLTGTGTHLALTHVEDAFRPGDIR